MLLSDNPTSEASQLRAWKSQALPDHQFFPTGPLAHLALHQQ
jgi:hypothetical protein